MYSLCCSAALIEYIVRLWKSMHSHRDLLDFPRIPSCLAPFRSSQGSLVCLQLGIFLQGLAEQLVDCFQLSVLMDVSLYESVYRSLEFLQPNGFVGGCQNPISMVQIGGD